MGNIFEYYHKGAWKYTTGAFSTEEEALVYRNQLKNQVFQMLLSLLPEMKELHPRRQESCRENSPLKPKKRNFALY